MILRMTAKHSITRPHDFTMLDPYVDKVLLLNDTIQAAGTPRVVLNSDAFREAFHLGQEWRAK